jgi:dolichol kinase
MAKAALFVNHWLAKSDSMQQVRIYHKHFFSISQLPFIYFDFNPVFILVGIVCAALG